MSMPFSPYSASRRNSHWLHGLLAASLVSAVWPAGAVSIKSVPVTVSSVPGNLVLVPSFEFPTFIGHANDPGQESTYLPATTYSGYFNTELCYAYQYDPVEANRYFYPSQAAASRSCAGKTSGGTPNQRLWSGNMLNWATSQAVDTYRQALTGGYRVKLARDAVYSASITGSNLSTITLTASERPEATYLEKATIDRWYYGNTPFRFLTNGDANQSSATPSQSTSGFVTRIGGLRNQMWFLPSQTGFGNTGYSFGNSPNGVALPLPVVNGPQTISDGSGVTAIPYDPSRHTLPNLTSSYVDSAVACTASETNCYAFPNNSYRRFAQYGNDIVYATSMRVKVCDGTLDTRDFCHAYGSYYKPEGLLQANPKNLRYSVFSYMDESGSTRRGGVMRARQKIIGPVSAAEVSGSETLYPDRSRIAGIDNPEWDSATGVIFDNPDSADAAATAARVGTCQSTDLNSCQINFSGVINATNRAGQIITGYNQLKVRDNYAELYYTALLYLRGLGNSSQFSNLTPSATSDPDGVNKPTAYGNTDGLPVIDNWYNTGSNTAVTPWTNSTTTVAASTAYDPMLYQCQTIATLGIGDTNTAGTGNAAWENDANGYTRDNPSPIPSLSPAAPANTYRDLTEWSSTGGVGNLAGLAYWGHVNDMRADVPNIAVPAGNAGAMKGQTLSAFFLDVVETKDLKNNNNNQFYNATKYGGYTIPDTDWQTTGNATAETSGWLGGATGGTANTSSWTSATQTVGTANAGLSNGNYYQPNNMYLANQGQKVVDGLNAAFGKIVAASLGSGASLAANGSQLNTGSVTYQTGYIPGIWTGNLRAFTVTTAGVINTTPSWEAVSLLPPSTAAGALTAAARTIKTCNGTCTGDSSAILFTTTAALSSAQRTALGADTTTQNTIINYLRGDATREVRNGGTLRNRTTTVLGDIVNSQPVFVGTSNASLYANRSFTGSSTYPTFVSSNTTRLKRLYVASNDGMLHGFSAETTTQSGVAPGQETFAYLPNAVILAGVSNLSSKNYGSNAAPHQFYNDGELTVSEAYLNGFGGCTGVSCWRTVLVGTTGRGPSKAIYALDITDPTAVKLLWERSSVDSNDIGSVVGKPIIAQIADGSWAVLLGNGYNSSNNKPALLQIALTTGTVTSYTTPGSSTNDGLAPPAVWIGNLAQNLSTQAYAGDLNGNVWRFDLGGSSTTGTLMYIAKDANGNTQPISSGMIAGRNPGNTTASEVWVFFGTGEALQTFIKPASQSYPYNKVQTWYGLIVQSSNAVNSGLTRAALQQRTIASEVTATATTPATRAISAASANDMVGKKGWYIDLLSPTTSPPLAQGERFLTPNQFQGRLLLGTTRLPPAINNPCVPSGAGWIMAINPFTGVPPTTNFFDVNNDGSFTSADNTNGSVTAGLGFNSLPDNPIFLSSRMLVNFDNGTTGSINTAANPGNIQRLSWRELIAQ